MSDPYIPLREAYIRQGINVYGHQNRIYTAGPTWALDLHPGGALIRLTYKPENVEVYVSTANLESAISDVSTLQVRTVSQPANVASAPGPDYSGLIPNQVRHSIAAEAPVSVAPAQDLGTVSEQIAEQRVEAIQQRAAEEVITSNEITQALKDMQARSDKAQLAVSSPEPAISASPAEPLDEAPLPSPKKKRGRPRKHPQALDAAVSDL